MTRRPPRHRVGSTYVLVLLVSAMVVTIGLSSMTVARLGHEETVGMGDVIAAHSVAIAGIEHAHHEIMLAIDSVSSSPTDWRTVVTDLPHGPFTVGGGSFTWVISDPTDDDLTDDTRDPVAVTVTAQSGTSTEIVRFTLAPGPGAAGLSCLQSALHAGGQVNFDGAFLSSDGVLSTNADFVANADIYASVEASGTVTGSTYHQPTLAGAASRDLPGTSALEYYLAHGTYLPMSAMEHVGSTDQHSDLQDLVLTPTLNPFGPPNPEGIYIVDCEGRHLKIKNSRIIGTIIVINADPAKPTKIEKSLTWQPAFPNYPALLVEGDLIFKLEDPPLNEAARFTNFNPVGAPFQGFTNATQTDDFPNVIKGLFYATGHVQFQEDNTNGEQYIEGVIVAGGNVTCTDNPEAHIRYEDTWALDPPPGFAEPTGPHALVPGSFVRIVN